MVARFFGKKIPFKTLRSICEVSKLGVTVKDLVDGLKAVGIDATPLAIDLETLESVPSPTIIYWNQNHFCVLYKVDSKRGLLHIADPASGKIALGRKDFLKSWCGNSDRGIAIVVMPGEEFDSIKFPRQKRFSGLLKFIVGELTNRKSVFLSLILLSILCMVSDMALPLLFQRTIDEGIAAKDVSLIWLLALGQLGIFFGNFTSTYVANYIMTLLGLKMDLEMVGAFLSKLISFPMSYFDSRASSDLIQKITDQSRIKGFLLSLPNTIFLIVINLLIFSGMLIYYSLPVFFIFLSLTFAGVGWTFLFMRKRRSIDYSYFSESADNRNMVYELVNGMMEIKTNNGQTIRLNKWGESQRRLNDLTRRSTLVNMASGGGSSVIARLREIIILGICATLVARGQLTIGAMMTITYITGRLSAPFSSFMEMITAGQEAHISYERLEEILETENENGSRTDFENNGVSFDNLSFHYAGNSAPWVLKDISLKVESGKTVAVVGESGCGKTTLIKLMLGFYRPQAGGLRLGGVPIEEADRESWMARCGVVHQQGYIFSDTIIENITISDKEPDIERVWEATRVAGIEDFIRKLPMGLNTRIGTTGLELSGGQKQRLMIARAVYRNPPLMFLDEATSSLDANNERTIMQRLKRYNENRTVFIAAHRLSTVKDADLILYMHEGRIIEQGTHQELVALNGEYMRLVKNQLDLSEA